MADVEAFRASPIAKLGPLALDRFARAVRDWVEEGALWVDLPWSVPDQFTQATRPLFGTGRDVSTPHGILVASGEQSFLWLDQQSLLPSRCMIGWTPCFREQATYDSLHQYGFIKIEAYRPLAPAEHPQEVLMKLVSSAQGHFERWSGGHARQRWFRDGSCDIEINGYEVGSYGVRQHPTLKGRRYVYGTVLAEPRFSTVLDTTPSKRVESSGALS